MSGSEDSGDGSEDMEYNYSDDDECEDGGGARFASLKRQSRLKALFPKVRLLCICRKWREGRAVRAPRVLCVLGMYCWRGVVPGRHEAGGHRRWVRLPPPCVRVHFTPRTPAPLLYNISPFTHFPTPSTRSTTSGWVSCSSGRMGCQISTRWTSTTTTR